MMESAPLILSTSPSPESTSSSEMMFASNGACNLTSSFSSLNHDDLALVKKKQDVAVDGFEGNETYTTFEESAMSSMAAGAPFVVSPEREEENDDILDDPYDHPSDYDDEEEEEYQDFDSFFGDDENEDTDDDDDGTIWSDDDDDNSPHHNTKLGARLRENVPVAVVEALVSKPNVRVDGKNSKKRVRFQESLSLESVVTVLSIDDYTREEWNRCWYSMKERSLTTERRLGNTIARRMLVSAIRNDDQSVSPHQQAQNIIFNADEEHNECPSSRLYGTNHGMFPFISNHNILTKPPRTLLRMLEKETRKLRL